MLRRSFLRWAPAARKTFAPANTIRTYMKFKVGDIDAHEIVHVEYELFGKKTPMAAENFAKLCSAEAVLPYQAPMETIADPGFKDQYEPQLTYVGSGIHRIHHDFIIQGGDLINRDGTGIVSVFGPSFEAPGELNLVSFDKPGLLGTAVSSPGENGSQFFILTDPSGAKHLDGSCICFGRVAKGLEELIAVTKTIPVAHDGQPLVDFRIVEAGIL